MWLHPFCTTNDRSIKWACRPYLTIGLLAVHGVGAGARSSRGKAARERVNRCYCLSRHNGVFPARRRLGNRGGLVLTHRARTCSACRRSPGVTARRPSHQRERPEPGVLSTLCRRMRFDDQGWCWGVEGCRGAGPCIFFRSRASEERQRP